MPDKSQKPPSSTVSPTDTTEAMPVVHMARPVWPPAQREYRRRETLSPAIKVLLLLLACLLVLSGMGLIVFSSAKQYRTTIHAGATFVAQSTRNSVNTAQAQNQSTAYVFSTAQANIEATATSQADATAAVTATVDNVTATATSLGDFYTRSTSGTPAFNNALSDNTGDGKWDEGTVATNTGCTFSDNYHVSEARQGYFQPCIAEKTNFNNFAYQAQLTINRGNPGQAGLLFRIDSKNKAYYFFRVGTDGSYGLDVYDTNGNVSTLISGFSSAVITGFGQANTLTVIAQDTHYYLFTNGQYVDTASDSKLQEGKIGVGAVDAGTPIDVTISNAQVWKL